MTMPEDTAAFYWYTEPNIFSIFPFKASCDGVETDEFQANGSAGAAYVGFWNPCGTLETCTITQTTGASAGFAIGEFGIAVQPNN